MSNDDIKYLLYSTNTMLHNKGLCIYALKDFYIKRHKMEFLAIHPELAPVTLPSFESILPNASKELNAFITESLLDVKATVNEVLVSCARQGVLFSHEILRDQMRPHVHRQAYSTNPGPCLTIHYRVGDDKPSLFNYWDRVSYEDSRKYDLCDNSNILKWCENKPITTLELTEKKNLILFDSGAIPHCVTHDNNLNIYFIFDNAILKDEISNIKFVTI